MMPCLERMIEDLEEKQWYISNVRPMFSSDNPEFFEDYQVTFSYFKNAIQTDKGLEPNSKFGTKQPTFLECVTQAWSMIHRYGVQS